MLLVIKLLQMLAMGCSLLVLKTKSRVYLLFHSDIDPLNSVMCKVVIGLVCGRRDGGGVDGSQSIAIASAHLNFLPARGYFQPIYIRS